MENVENFFNLYGPVEILEADDDFKRHMRERHRNITVTDVAEVHANPEAEYFDNEGYDEDQTRAPVAMLGYPLSGGPFLTVPIDPTGEYGVWRVRTAYAYDEDDEKRYWDFKTGGA